MRVLDRRIKVWTSAALLGIALGAGVCYRSIEVLIANAGSVVESQRIVTALDRLLSTMKDAETGQRGYIITGDEQYLAPYALAVGQIDQQLRALEQSVAGRSGLEAFPRLKGHVFDKLAELAETIDLRRTAGFDAAVAVVRENRGRHYMMEARARVAELQAAENERLARQEEQSRKSARRALTTLALVTALNLALLTTAIIALRRDVLSRIRAAASLRESEAKFRSTFEQAAVGVAHVSVDGRWLEQNQKLREIFGYGATELRTHTLRDLTFPEDREVDSAHLARLLRGEIPTYTVEKRCLRQDGQLIWVNMTASLVRTPDGEPAYFIFVIEDIQPRKQAEAALSASESRFRILVEQVEDYAIYLVDLRGYVTSWNTGAQQLKQYSEAEAIGLHLSVFYTAEARQQGAVERGLEAATKSGHFAEEGWRVKKDGTRFWALASFTALRDLNGNVVGFAEVVKDLTERRAAETEIRALAEALERRVTERTQQLEEANVALEAFAYSVSHDLRAPLRGMQGFAQALLEDYADRLDETGRDYAQRVVTAAAELDRLILDLLDYSRLSRRELPLEPLDLRRVVQEVLRHLAPEIAAAQAEVTSEVIDCPVRANRLVLVQAINNLLGNALKFVPHGEHAVVRIYCKFEAATVRLCVEDRGVGIHPDHHQRIFNVFERLHATEEYPGTGVGLAIVRKGLERMGGAAGVDSAPGQGSTFWIELPRAELHVATPALRQNPVHTYDPAA